MNNSITVQKAIYSSSILPEHNGNPFIESLPPKEDIQAVMKKLAYYPPCTKKERNIDDPLKREEYLERLTQLRQPFALYYETFRSIERAIRSAYADKNPLLPSTQNFLHYTEDTRPTIKPNNGFFKSNAECITLIGESGVGKTSMIEQILSCFPQVIIHSKYKDTTLEYKEQVLWIKIDCPHNSSVRDLCENILEQLDSIMSNEPTKPDRTIGSLIRQILQRIKTSFLGILIIDEMQNLKFKRTGGEDTLLKFLHSLVNNLGVPLMFCGNPPFDDSLSKTLKSSRRAESGGFYEMIHLEHKSEEWKIFIEELWLLQWTNIETALTEELNNKLYELSTGNVDLAMRTFRESQRLLIGTHDESISTNVLEQGNLIACGLSSRTEHIMYMRSNYMNSKNKSINDSTVKTSGMELNAKKPTIHGDINRPAHPEFEENINHLLLSNNIHELIINPDIIRSSINKEPYEYLESIGLIRNDIISALN